MERHRDRLSGRLTAGDRLGTVVLGLLALVPVGFLAVFFGWPVGAIVGRGIVVDGSLDLGAFGDVLGRARTWRVVGTTLAQSVAGTALAVLVGVPGAYVLYRLRFPGRDVVRALVTVPFVLPTVVVGVAFRSLLVEGGPLGGLGADGTFVAVVAALVFFNYAVVVRTVGSMWAHLDPRPEQAARALGATPAQVFREVTLPALTPAIASAASLVFLFCATSFGTVLVLGGLGYGTVETEIWVQTTQFLDLRTAAVLSLLQLVVVTASLAVSGWSRRRREVALRLGGRSSGRSSGRGAATGTDRAVSRRDLPVLLGTVVVIVGLLVTPLAGLAVRSLRTADGWGWDNYANLATRGSGGTLEVSVWQAMLNSLQIAVDATWLAMLVGGCACVVLSRRPRRPAGRRALGVLDATFMLPLGVSAVTVGFGFLVTLDRLPGDLRTSVLLVPIAQAVVAVPLVIRTLLPVLRAIDHRLRDAAAVLGASPLRVLATVDLPVLGRSLGIAVGFCFAVSLGEFGATSFLARPEAPTLPVAIFGLIGRPGADNLGMALAASVLLGVVVAVVVAVAERLRVPGGTAEL